MIFISFIGGMLTILSPCILPIVPLILVWSEKSVRSTVALLIGMALTFALVASLAVASSEWIIQANQIGRWVALWLMAIFALALLLPRVASYVMAPLASVGARLNQLAGPGKGMFTSLLAGIATGLLWAPCAGPILGLILTTAMLNGASASTGSLLLAYALGAGVSLALFSLVGNRLFNMLKRTLGIGEGIRRGLGALMLVSATVIALGWDTTLLVRLSSSGTNAIEQTLLKLIPDRSEGVLTSAMAATGTTRLDLNLPIQGRFPSLTGAAEWLNSPEITNQSLRGKVVLIDFWTYSCINCLRTIPYVKAWAEKYQESGLVVIGVHTPEFAFEKIPANVKRAVMDLGITYPVAIDNQYMIWRAFRNQYWPAHYFIDAKGNIRYSHFGEGGYAYSEQVIQQLLEEAGQSNFTTTPVQGNGTGASAAANIGPVSSRETYIGYERSGGRFSSTPRVARDASQVYQAKEPSLNGWGLDGVWQVGAEYASLHKANGRIIFKFQARDLHLVMGPSSTGESVRFKVRLNGKSPEEDRGSDIQADGSGVVDSYRLYQLIRKSADLSPSIFEIEFLDPGVNAYVFTFG